MDVKFTKLHGAGNDYLYIDGIKIAPAIPSVADTKIGATTFGKISTNMI